MSRRWIGWHLFCIVMVAVLVTAGAWQWSVAIASTGPDGESNVNIRNLVYALQWWVFAAFGIWFWLRFLRDQRDADREEEAMAELDSDEPNRHKVGGRSEHSSAAGQSAHVGLPIDGADVGDEGTREATQISLDDSAEVRRQRSRTTMGTAADPPPTTAPAHETGSDSVTPSDHDNRTATER